MSFYVGPGHLSSCWCSRQFTHGPIPPTLPPLKMLATPEATARYSTGCDKPPGLSSHCPGPGTYEIWCQESIESHAYITYARINQLNMSEIITEQLPNSAKLFQIERFCGDSVWDLRLVCLSFQESHANILRT